MASLATFLSIATVVFGRTLSDAILLSVRPAVNIANFFIYSSLALMAVSVVYYRLLRAVHPARLNAGFLLLFSVMTLIFESFSGASATWYIQAYATFLITAPALGNIIAWNAIGDAFNARQGRRLFYIVCAFSTIGGIVAGACIPMMLDWFGFSSLPISYCLLFATATVPVIILHRNRRSEKTMLTMPHDESGSMFREFINGFDDVVRSPLIRNLSVVFFLTAVTTNIIDYSLKDYLQTNFDQNGIAYFYGQFNAISNGFNLVVQLTLLSSFLTRFRTRTLFAVTPIVLLVFTFPFLFVYSAVCVVLMRFMDVALRFVIQDAAREIALSPLPRLLRNRAKVIFKGVMNPLGGITAGVVLNILAGMMGPRYLPLLIIPVALLSLYCVRNLNRYCANHLYMSLQSSAIKEGILVPVEPADEAVVNVAQVDPAQLVDPDENVRMGALDAFTVLKSHDEEALSSDSLRKTIVEQIRHDARLAQATLVCRLAISKALDTAKNALEAALEDTPQKAADAVKKENYRQDDAAERSDTASCGDVDAAERSDTASCGDVDAAERSDTVSYGDVDAAEHSDTVSYGDDDAAEHSDTVSYGDDDAAERSDTVSCGDDGASERSNSTALGEDGASESVDKGTDDEDRILPSDYIRIIDSLSDAYVAATQRVFKGLMLLHKTEIVAAVYQSLASSRASTRAQALELLQLTISNTPYGKRILVMCDDVDLADKCRRLNEIESLNLAGSLDILRVEESRSLRRLTRKLEPLAEKMASG